MSVIALFPNRRPYTPSIPVLPVVADLESPIDGHDRALAAAHAFGDSRDDQIGFRQKVSNPADLHFRHAPTLSSHRFPPPHSKQFSVGPHEKKYGRGIDFHNAACPSAVGHD